MCSRSGQAANSMFRLSPPREGWHSKTGPSFSRSTFSGSGQKITPWGLPTSAGITVNFSPAASKATAGKTRTGPMSTVTRSTSFPRMCSSRDLGPAPVSMVRQVFRVSPLSQTYLPTHRIPLPHMVPREPSALYISMAKSPPRPGQMQMIPSAPTPKCRSDSRTAIPGRSGGVPSRQLR